MPEPDYLCPWCGGVIRIPLGTYSHQTHYKDILDAAKEGTVGDVRYFIEQRGISVNARHKNGNTPLHFAAAYNHVEVLDYLISKGALINATNVLGSTPLHYAANFTANIEVVRHLIRADAFVNARKHSPDGRTPLDMVEFNWNNDNWRISDILIESGGISGSEF